MAVRTQTYTIYHIPYTTHTLLIINAIAHSDEIIPASLFSPINVKFLCSHVHLSYIILCRLSCCCILFVSGRLFYYVSPSQNGYVWTCVYGIRMFHNIAFHARMNVFNNVFPLVRQKMFGGVPGLIVSVSFCMLKIRAYAFDKLKCFHFGLCLYTHCLCFPHFCWATL